MTGGSPLRVCVDLTPLEMIDRHGGIGKYAAYLLEAMLAVDASERRGLELYALVSSTQAPVSAEAALEIVRSPGAVIRSGRHRWQRRALGGALLRAGGIDLFHATQPNALPVLAGCALVSTAHDIIPIVFPREGRGLGPALDRRRARLLHATRYARPNHLIAISELTKRDLERELHIQPSRISVVRHGVDMRRFRPEVAADEREATRARHGLPERWFVCVSSDHYRKNHMSLFDAWCAVADRVPEGLVFVGKALYEGTLDRIAAEVSRRGLAGRFRWLDDVDDDALPALYRGATAMIAPSLYEGFGMTLLEAMACATPVGAARSPAYVEVGADAALFFEPKDVGHIGALLETFSKDEGLRDSLKERGLALARAATWEKAALETLAVYRKVLRIS